jgi:hypothetical protein
VQGAVSVAGLASDDADLRTNSAPVTAAARAFWPAADERLGVAAELVYNAPRRDRMGGQTEHMLLMNLVASGKLGSERVKFRVGVFNLLDWDYRVPVGSEFVQIALPQAGRSFVAYVAYEY